MTSAKNTITIHLDGSTYNEKEPIIQQDLLDRMDKRIREDVLKNKRIDTSLSGDYYPEESWNLCYMVKGGRGSGKSFFLNRLTKKLTTSTGNPECTIKKLLSCDPSLMNESHHFILSVVAAINTGLDALETRSAAKVGPCREAVVELAAGIARSADKAKYIADVDKYRISEIRETSSEFPGQMRRKFGEVISQLCKLHDVDAMLITIDDVDVYTKQCMDVLEAIRLCLACPKCVVIISGDIKVYDERIREHYYCQFDRDYQVNDIEGKERRKELISELSTQYFIKLFPINRQYELATLKELIETDQIHFAYGENVKGLKGIYKYLLTACFSHDHQTHYETLCELPLRSQINIIKKLKEKDALPTVEAKRPEFSCKLSHDFSDVLIDILGTTCLRHGYDFSNIKNNVGDTFYKLLTQYCYDSNTFMLGTQLALRNSGKQVYRYVALILAVNAKCIYKTESIHKNIDGLFSYLLFGPITVSALEHTLKQRGNVDLSNRSALEQFNTYFKVGGCDQPIPWAKRISLILAHEKGEDLMRNGILTLKDKNQVEVLQDFLNSEEANKDGTYVNSKIRLALGASIIRAADKDFFQYISPYNVYGLVVDCVRDISRSEIGGSKADYRLVLKKGSSRIKAEDKLRLIRLFCGEATEDDYEKGPLTDKDYEVIGSLLLKNKGGESYDISAIRSCIEQIKDTLAMMSRTRAGERPAWATPPATGVTNTGIVMANHYINDNEQKKEFQTHLQFVALEILNWYLDVVFKLKIPYGDIRPDRIAGSWKQAFEALRDISFFVDNERNSEEHDMKWAMRTYAYSQKTQIYRFPISLYDSEGQDIFKHCPLFDAFHTFMAKFEAYTTPRQNATAKTEPT